MVGVKLPPTSALLLLGDVQGEVPSVFSVKIYVYHGTTRHVTTTGAGQKKSDPRSLRASGSGGWREGI